MILSGQFAPISALPGWLQSVAHALPYYWTLGFPLELLVGRASVEQVPMAIAILLAWIVATFAIFQPAWRAGTRAFEAVGQ